MSSIESLSMGLVCMTEMIDKYRNFIPDHPFIEISKSNFKKKITQLSKNKEILMQKKIESKEWVKKYHDIESVCSYTVIMKKIHGSNKKTHRCHNSLLQC